MKTNTGSNHFAIYVIIIKMEFFLQCHLPCFYFFMAGRF